MTSRSEYRLILRQDNADVRLTPIGHELGLIDEERWQKFLEKQAQVEGEIKRLQGLTIAPSDALNAMLVSRETVPLTTGMKAAELIRRPQIGYEDLAPFDPKRLELPRAVAEEVEVSIKYEGYIKKQLAQVEEMRRLEGTPRQRTWFIPPFKVFGWKRGKSWIWCGPSIWGRLPASLG